MRSLWIKLLGSIGTVFVESDRGSKANMLNFSKDLYRLAFVNKIVLTYLSRVRRDGISEKLFHYHNRRLNALMRVLTNVVQVLDEHGFRYVVFKTLKPFREEVADIDILCLGDETECIEITHAIGSRGYRLMEHGLYCTTFEDPRYKFVTEVMIDIYREVSAGPLIYLDKRLLRDHVVVCDIDSARVKVLDPVAEALVTVGHSVVKERRIILVDYLTIMNYMSSMRDEQLEDFVGLARRARLVHASRWFLTLASRIHKVVHGFIPEELARLINELGGAVDPDISIFEQDPPFLCSKRVLVGVFAEKLGDPLFRASIVSLAPWLFRGRSLYRIAELLVRRL